MGKTNCKKGNKRAAEDELQSRQQAIKATSGLHKTNLFLQRRNERLCNDAHPRERSKARRASAVSRTATATELGKLKTEVHMCCKQAVQTR